MSDVPNINDPVVAVFMDRFSRFEQTAKDEFIQINARLEAIEKSNSAIANRAKGGYMVLLGLGTAASYFMGAFEWLGKILMRGAQ